MSGAYKGKGYAPIGLGPEGGAPRASSPLNTALWLTFLLMCVGIAASVGGLAIFFAVHNGSRDSQQDTRLTNAESADAALCDKIASVNNTLQAEDAALDARIVALESANDTGILTLNGAPHGGVRNFDVVSGGPGLDVATDVGIMTLTNTGVTSLLVQGGGFNVSGITGDITIENTAVLSVTGVFPTGGNVNLVGISGISVTAGPGPSDVTVSGLALATAIDGLDMLTTMHTQEIMELQTQINNFNISSATILDMIAGDVDAFNMTLISLLMQIATLQQTVDSLVANNNDTTPTGVMVPWAGTPSSVPTGYLLCDGSTQLQVAYMDLFSVIGCAYCPMSMCTMSNFCLPDMRGRIAVGERTSGPSVFATRGGVAGEETHVLLTTELAQHIHGANAAGTHSHGGVTGNTAGPGHTFRIALTENLSDNGLLYPDPIPATASDPVAFGDLSNNCPALPGPEVHTYLGLAAFPGSVCNGAPNVRTHVQGSTTPGNVHSHSISADGSHTHVPAAEGSNVAHNNVQPSTTVGGYIIKT
jgi:microcystin-dependent protein